MLSRAIYSILSTDTDVSGLAGTNISPVRAKQGATKPYIIYSFISNTPNKTKQSTSLVDVERLQVDVYADTYEGSKILAGYVREAMDGYRGTVETVIIDHIIFDNESSTDDDNFLGGQEFSYRIIQEYFIRIKK